MSIFNILDQICERVDMLDNKQIEQIGSKAKELNRDLEACVSRLTKEIDYDKNKIDLLYHMTEKWIESEQHVLLILERLLALEKIHKESPNL